MQAGWRKRGHARPASGEGQLAGRVGPWHAHVASGRVDHLDAVAAGITSVEWRIPPTRTACAAGRQQDGGPGSRLGLYRARHRPNADPPNPRGRILGGSSAVNATVALRARGADFAKWGSRGAEGWSFDDVLPAFRMPENTPTGDDAHHGRTGPLPIRQHTDGGLTPFLRGFVEAAVALGFKRVHDFNGAQHNGADGYPVDVVDGVRQNVGPVHLTAGVRRRPNLTIRGDVTIDRVLFDGTTAMVVLAADGTVYRGREVILSGGTYGSPAILLRSGVGPADELAALGIGVVADLPVGRQLQNQPGYHQAYALAPGYLEMTPAVGSLLWTASTEAAGDGLDLHVNTTHLMPGSLSPTGRTIVVMAALVQPESTGTLKLASRTPGHSRRFPGMLFSLIVLSDSGQPSDSKTILRVLPDSIGDTTGRLAAQFRHITRTSRHPVPGAWARLPVSWHAIFPCILSDSGQPSDPGILPPISPRCTGNTAERLVAQRGRRCTGSLPGPGGGSAGTPAGPRWRAAPSRCSGGPSCRSRRTGARTWRRRWSGTSRRHARSHGPPPSQPASGGSMMFSQRLSRDHLVLE